MQTRGALLLVCTGLHRLHHLFHLHEPRTLDQHTAYLRHHCAYRLLQGLHALKILSSCTKGSSSKCTLLAERKQLRNALFLRQRACFRVELRAVVAHLTHITQHQQLRRGQLAQHFNGGFNRIGVGVVGVIHHSHSAP